MEILEELGTVIGAERVLTGADAAPWARDWTGAYEGTPLAVLRPGSTAEVCSILSIANAARMPVVPVSGNTGINGGALAEGALALSLDRMNKVREIRTEARIAVVEAGVILDNLHAATEAEGLLFPMTFGARGSCRIGGMLSTNAGGSNVLRYGNMRDLCLGIEAVMADGRVMDLMSALHKDNSGYALRDLLIGAEGTLGVITAAVLKLAPQPRVRATAMVAAASLDASLALLNRLQEVSGGAVDAYEFMPSSYIDGHLRLDPAAREPFAARHDVNILVELATTRADEAQAGNDGVTPLIAALERALAGALQDGLVLDATIARSEAQRREMWERREAAAEIGYQINPAVHTDIALPLDRVSAFFEAVAPRAEAIDAGVTDLSVAHLGDGNIHYSLYPSRNDPEVMDALREVVEDVVAELGGSFSAEHGIGLSKRTTMARRKDPVALDAMRAIKAALDPHGILNPGKVLPAAG